MLLVNYIHLLICRGNGIARQLVDQPPGGAGKQALHAIYLITDHYFDQYGFAAVSHEHK
ncbi:hypothetical protein [Dyadobacter bucti]|uniref:hypothetical protein n=1 Tax=Dyadobacter bucti TaxID=2572203 RepID=UPI001408342B|nr:hypothetical protein [Dyadobacter bucti]